MEALPENHLPLGPCFVKVLVKPLDVFMHGPDLSRYFDFVPGDAPRVREVFRGGPDPLDTIRAQWEAAGWTCVPAIEHLAADGKPYHSDLILSLEDNDLQAAHVDTFQGDWLTSLSRFARRISFNIFLGVPDEGGFAVFRRPRGRARGEAARGRAAGRL
ncbi:Hypothetical protein A7982_05170 [Minicystis rosea]|nr:Hypothetical protein A7982_05170 [Minicystis rosea]